MFEDKRYIKPVVLIKQHVFLNYCIWLIDFQDNFSANKIRMCAGIIKLLSFGENGSVLCTAKFKLISILWICVHYHTILFVHLCFYTFGYFYVSG